MAADRLNYAGFWRRLVAFMVDTVIYSLVLVAGAHLLGAVESLPWQFDVFAYALALSYYALCECSQWQGTIGKRIYRLRVTGLDGGRLNIGQALRRN
ncbi:MAG: RDD family protein, partial [Negativicutes bacterium]|nr:RDD family protein [Negativicutes bacterium]